MNFEEQLIPKKPFLCDPLETRVKRNMALDNDRSTNHPQVLAEGVNSWLSLIDCNQTPGRPYTSQTTHLLKHNNTHKYDYRYYVCIYETRRIKG